MFMLARAENKSQRKNGTFSHDPHHSQLLYSVYHSVETRKLQNSNPNAELTQPVEEKQDEQYHSQRPESDHRRTSHHTNRRDIAMCHWLEAS
jgi:hypothetical protein